MNKRGREEILMTVVWILVILSFLGIMLSWIGDASSGKLTMAQMSAKEAALIIDSARIGTEITFNNPLEIKGNNITSKMDSSSFSYSHLNGNAEYSDGKVRVHG